MKILEIIQHLETIAPPELQEDYDNSGLITGDVQQECSGVLVCLDCTENVIREAIKKGEPDSFPSSIDFSSCPFRECQR